MPVAEPEMTNVIARAATGDMVSLPHLLNSTCLAHTACSPLLFIAHHGHGVWKQVENYNIHLKLFLF
jgi:hypothetical protein